MTAAVHAPVVLTGTVASINALHPALNCDTALGVQGGVFFVGARAPTVAVVNTAHWVVAYCPPVIPVALGSQDNRNKRSHTHEYTSDRDETLSFILRVRSHCVGCPTRSILGEVLFLSLLELVGRSRDADLR